jgi:methionyl aminopeptidase
MSIECQADLTGLQRIGRLVAETLRLMRRQVAPGVTTGRLDDIARRQLRRNGARSAPRLTYGYPGVTCISVNDEAAHGIPGRRHLRPGDLVKLDVSAELDGYFADAAITVAVPPVTLAGNRLIAGARAAREAGIAAARVGAPIREIGRAVEAAAAARGLTVIRDLPGHGVGRALHEKPSVPQHYDPTTTGLLSEGLVITIEPHLTLGSGELEEAADGWTLRTRDRGQVAQFEHTVVVTAAGPVVVTT